ncbi:Exonuclease, partial [Piedraia hortae CBS 480.64]
DEVNIGLHPTHKLGRYVALDCEMVGAGPPPYRDHVLARVSLVNFHGEEIYDSYVQPPAGVVIGNYRTAVSGIEPHHLSADVARPFEEVRAQVAELIRQRILIGHGVRNDLSVLQLTHPWGCIRDTSLFRKFIRENGGKKPALRDLVRRELGLSIQNGEHCSIEDARATMLLYVKEKVAFEEDCRRLFG